MNKQARIHRICATLRWLESPDADRVCNRCPAWEVDADYGNVQRGCYGIAEELYNYGRHGNAWGHPVVVWLKRRWYRLRRLLTEGRR